MRWDIEYTDAFDSWWQSLTQAEQDSIAVGVRLLEEMGPHLPFPWSSSIVQSKHDHMRELRVQHRGKPYRVLCAFDPRRVGPLLLGGDKTGAAKWYSRNVPLADALYDEHLITLKHERLR